MIRDGEFQKFEIEMMRNEKVNIKRNFQIVEALHEEAISLGVIPLKNPLEGLEVDVRIAKVINSVSKTA
jgi:prephenate dehydratase